MLKPAQKSEFDICLTDGRSKREWNLTLDGGGSAVQRSSITDDQFAIYIRNVGKQIGNFDEQRDWKGGRGAEYFSENPDRYLDSMNCWTLSSGHVTPSPRWKYATGYRVVDSNIQTGNVAWKSLLGTSRYISLSFTAAGGTMDKDMFLIRRRGNPGTLSYALVNNSGGDPTGSTLKTSSVTTATITDIVSVYHVFDFSSTQALTGGTTYHVYLFGASTDNAANHWEVAVDTSGSSSKISSAGSSWTAVSFSMYHRLMDADTAQRWFFWTDDTNFFMVSKKDSGNSQVYQADSSAVLTEKTGHGLGTVTSRPIVANAYHFFPQGESTNIRRWDGASTWAADGTNKATFLQNGYDQSAGAVIWRANTTAGSVSSVSYANVAVSNLTFNTAVPIGNLSGTINGIYFWTNNGLYVFKSDSVWQVQKNVATYLDYGLKDAPDPSNGQAAISKGQFLYFNWLFSDERLFGATLDDIGQGWRGPAIPNGREGKTARYCTYVNLVLKAVDAGASGTSSVMAWDGVGWHEIFRAPQAGKRIRDLAIQVISGSRNRLWIDCGGDLIYMDMPYEKARPIDDSSFNYQHEGVLYSSILDMGAASKLPKLIKDLTATTKNLNGSGIRIEVDYQVDDQCGKDGIANWTTIQPFLKSPEDSVRINQGHVTQFAYRFRLMTDDSDVPPDLKAVVPSGFARSPYRLTWNMRVRTGGKNAPQSDDLDDWLLEAGRFPGRILMTSKWRSLHNYYVIVAPPTQFPVSEPTGTQKEESVYTLSLVEHDRISV